MLILAGVGALSCAIAGEAQAAAGWQAPAVVTITAGQVSEFIHYGCPSSLPVAQNGSFEFNSVGQEDDVYLGYNGPRYDESPPDYSTWGWHFYWPSGAKSGETVDLNIMCEAKESK